MTPEYKADWIHRIIFVYYYALESDPSIFTINLTGLVSFARIASRYIDSIQQTFEEHSQNLQRVHKKMAKGSRPLVCFCLKKVKTWKIAKKRGKIHLGIKENWWLSYKYISRLLDYNWNLKLPLPLHSEVKNISHTA